MTPLLLLLCAADRPNVVLIMADDLGVEAVGCYGGLSCKTPSVDRLADDGLRFTNAFATPLCSPTRVELMTGRSAHRDWIGFGLLNPKARTFGHLLQDAGYRTGMVGKWQLTSYDPPDYPGAAERRNTGMRPQDAGFDTVTLFHTGHTEDKGSRYAGATIDFDGEVRQTDQYGPDVFVEAAEDFIAEATARSTADGRPWFLYYSMCLPHWPMQPTPDSPEWSDPAKRSDTDVRHFPAMVEYMDRCVGRVVDAVDASGAGEDTVVIFYADNGSHLDTASLTTAGWRHGGKGLSTDAGTRVPLVVRWPAEGRVGVTDALVGPTDFYVTLAALCDANTVDGPIDFARGPDGHDFSGEIRGTYATPRRAWTCVYDPRPGWDKDRFTALTWSTNGRYKLYADGRLYDTAEDRHENFPIAEADRGADRRDAAALLRAEIDRMTAE